MHTRPFTPIIEYGITELIGKNEKIDAQDYAASAEFDVRGAAGSQPVSGEILSFLLVTLETSGGAVLTPAGWIYIFAADPAIAAGDTSLVAAGVEHKTIIGKVRVTSADWDSDAAGGAAFVACSVPFHPVSYLYLSFRPDAGSVSINSAAGDDEEMHVNFWYRRDS